MSVSRRDLGMAAGAAVGGVIAWTAWRAGRRVSGPPLAPNQTIVIVGAGFGGMSVARRLADRLPRRDDGRIILVDRNNYLLFTPMLTEIAGGELDGRHIVASPRQLSPRVTFTQATVDRIDLSSRSVSVSTGVDGERSTIGGDHLVLALGSVSNYHDVPGVAEHSIGMKSIRDAISVRHRVLRALEAANLESDPAVKRQLLTFVVAGGGFTGVETIGALNDMVRSAAARLDKIRPDEISAVLVEPGSRLLQELSADLARYAREKLEEHGVRVLLNTKITSADAAGVAIDPGGRIDARTLVWTAGVKPNPLVETLDCRRGHHGGIIVDECCAVPDRPGVWALGDCAEVPNRRAHGSYAPTAQNATREGVLVADNIVATLRGAPRRPFTYQPVGELALVGRHAGVGKVYGLRFSGAPAWAMWRAVYLAKMPTLAQRCRIAADWVLDAMFGRILADEPSVADAVTTTR